MKKIKALFIALVMLIGVAGVTAATEGVAHATGACSDGLGKYITFGWDSGTSKPVLNTNCTGQTAPATDTRLPVGCTSACNFYIFQQFGAKGTASLPAIGAPTWISRVTWYAYWAQAYDSTGAPTGSPNYPAGGILPNSANYGDVTWTVWVQRGSLPALQYMQTITTTGAPTQLSNFWYPNQAYVANTTNAPYSHFLGLQCGVGTSVPQIISGQPKYDQETDGHWSIHPWASVSGPSSNYGCSSSQLGGRSYTNISSGAVGGASEFEAVCVDLNDNFDGSGDWKTGECVTFTEWWSNSKNWDLLHAIPVADYNDNGVHKPAQMSRVRVVIRFDENAANPPTDQFGNSGVWVQSWCSVVHHSTGGCATTGI